MRFLSRSSAVPRHPRHARLTRWIKVAALCGMVALLGAFGGGAAWLVRSGRVDAAIGGIGSAIAEAGARIGFAVETVSVEGRMRESRAVILEALRVKQGMPLLSVDLAASKTRLEALPWVRKAEVERLLPDRLFVRLIERRPLALWQHEGRFDLLADDGTVVSGAQLGEFGRLVVLVGDDVPKIAAKFLGMLATEPLLASHVVSAVRVGGRRWNVRLDSGIDVALPEDDPESAWHRLAAIERSNNLLERNVLAVDLRLPDRLVVRLPPDPPKPAPKRTRQAGKPT